MSSSNNNQDILDDEVTDDCELLENNLYLTDAGNVLYNSDVNIVGFQFGVDGTTVSGTSGGETAVAAFTVSTGDSTVLGFSFTGAIIPAGCGVLTTLALDGEATGLSGLVFSDSGGSDLGFSYYDDGSTATVVGCTDISACNYDAMATDDDGSCAYAQQYYDCAGNCVSETYDCAGVCHGDAVEDCAGVCDGDAVEDCAGICNGDALVDECGACDNDLANDCVQDCAGTWGGDALDGDDDGVCYSVDKCPELLGAKCNDGCPTGDLNSDSLYTAADVLQMRDQYVSTGLINSLDDLSSPDDLDSDGLLGECSPHDMTGDSLLDY